MDMKRFEAAKKNPPAGVSPSELDSSGNDSDNKPVAASRPATSAAEALRRGGIGSGVGSFYTAQADVEMDEDGDGSGDRKMGVATDIAVEGKRPSYPVKNTKKKSKQRATKKPKDMPRRPMSAYNFFFQGERSKMLEDARRKQMLGQDRASKIGFESMAKTVAKRWRELTPEELAPFQKLAQDDMERYRIEMEEYQAKLARRCRLEGERPSADDQEQVPSAVAAPTSSSFIASAGQNASSLRSSSAVPNQGLHTLAKQQQQVVPQNIYVQSVTGQTSEQDALVQLEALLCGALQASSQQQASHPAPAALANQASFQQSGSNIDLSTLQSQRSDAGASQQVEDLLSSLFQQSSAPAAPPKTTEQQQQPQSTQEQQQLQALQHLFNAANAAPAAQQRSQLQELENLFGAAMPNSSQETNAQRTDGRVENAANSLVQQQSQQNDHQLLQQLLGLPTGNNRSSPYQQGQPINNPQSFQGSLVQGVAASNAGSYFSDGRLPTNDESSQLQQQLLVLQAILESAQGAGQQNGNGSGAQFGQHSSGRPNNW